MVSGLVSEVRCNRPAGPNNNRRRLVTLYLIVTRLNADMRDVMNHIKNVVISRWQLPRNGVAGGGSRSVTAKSDRVARNAFD